MRSSWFGLGFLRVFRIGVIGGELVVSGGLGLGLAVLIGWVGATSSLRARNAYLRIFVCSRVTGDTSTAPTSIGRIMAVRSILRIGFSEVLGFAVLVVA